MPEILQGKEIEDIYTLGSCYDNGYIIGLRANGQTFRMDIKEFLPVLKGLILKGQKKRKYVWLEIKKKGGETE